MQTKDLLIVGAVGLGAYVLFSNREKVGSIFGGVGTASEGLGEGISQVAMGLGSEAPKLLRQTVEATGYIPKTVGRVYSDVVVPTTKGVGGIISDVTGTARTGTSTLRKVSSDASKVITTASSTASSVLQQSIRNAPSLSERSGLKVDVSAGTVGIRIPTSGGYSQVSYDVAGAYKEVAQKTAAISSTVKKTASSVLSAVKSTVSKVASTVTKSKSIRTV